MNHFKHLGLGVALVVLNLLLTSCSLHDAQQEAHPSSRTWKTHADQVAQINAWTLSGKMGIRTAKEGASGHLLWLQRRDYFDLSISGPLGQGASRLTGYPGRVTLVVSGQPDTTAARADDLLDQQLGWKIPVENLFWWVRGLPSPQSPYESRLDAQARLKELIQDGWNVSYANYKPFEKAWLPTRLVAMGHNLKITLVINNWQPSYVGHRISDKSNH